MSQPKKIYFEQKGPKVEKNILNFITAFQNFLLKIETG